MHRTAEYGIAAHWRYKEGKQIDELDTKLSWLRRILDWQSEARDSSDFGEAFEVRPLCRRGVRLHPKGDVISLPRGATPLDFAYRIHSAVGNRCIGAKVNGRIVPLSSALETGDFVEVMTSQASHGPSRDWLNIVKTSEAKAKIRAWLKKEEREENIVKGKEMLAAEAKKAGYTMAQLTKADILEPVFKRYSLSSLDDLYATIGFGGLSTLQLLNRLTEEYKKQNKAEAPPLPIAEKPADEAKKPAPSSSSNGVIVKGESGMLVRFARCCNPPARRRDRRLHHPRRGVSVHRADCINLKDAGVEPERMIEVEWESSGAGSYEADIQMLCYDHAGLFAEISLMFASQDVPVTAVTAHTVKNKQGLCTMNMTIVIKTTQQLDKLLRDLQKRPDVIEVFRVAR